MDKFSNQLEFERSDRYGWVTMNINLLGTGICCKIRSKLQHSLDHIENIAQKSCVKINSIDANECENGFIVELINQRTFGLSEFECIQQFYNNIRKFMEMIETQNDTIEKSNEIDTRELCENANELNEGNVNADINGTENPAANENNIPNQDEQSEPKINTEKHEIDENIGKVGMDDINNETLGNIEGNIEGKATAGDGGNTTNILESNNANEHNADNTVENEIVKEEEKMNEATPIEPNEMENAAPQQSI